MGFIHTFQLWLIFLIGFFGFTITTQALDVVDREVCERFLSEDAEAPGRFLRPVKVKFACQHGVFMSPTVQANFDKILIKMGGMGPVETCHGPRSHLGGSDMGPAPATLDQIMTSFGGYDYAIDILGNPYLEEAKRVNRLSETVAGRRQLLKELESYGEPKFVEIAEERFAQSKSLLPRFIDFSQFKTPMDPITAAEILQIIINREAQYGNFLPSAM